MITYTLTSSANCRAKEVNLNLGGSFDLDLSWQQENSAVVTLNHSFYFSDGKDKRGCSEFALINWKETTGYTQSVQINHNAKVINVYGVKNGRLYKLVI